MPSDVHTRAWIALALTGTITQQIAASMQTIVIKIAGE